MTKVLVATEKPFAPAAVDQIKKIASQAGFIVMMLEKYTNQADLLTVVEEADALIVRSDKVDAAVLDAAKHLKIVVRAGAGYDNVDLEAAKAHGVVVMNTPGQNSNAVAELAIGMMIFNARNGFNGKAGSELKDKKLGIHAYGNVGKRVADLARGFGMEIFAYDPFIPRETIEADGVTCVDSVEELYRNSNYVSLHIPANEQTKQSVNYSLLSSMLSPAILVNTARKEVINEADLMKIMEERSDFSYLSDIKPDNAAELEEKFPGRCFFTPKKMGAQTAEANLNAGVAAIRQIIGFINDGDTTFQVNK
jgi:D-3-phosphoglycerate dehydrogenase